MQLKSIHATSGEIVLVSNQWAAECEKRGTTIAASAWGYKGTGALTGATLATPLATVKLAPTCTGLLTNTVTLANGEVLKAVRSVFVTADAGGAVTA